MRVRSFPTKATSALAFLVLAVAIAVPAKAGAQTCVAGTDTGFCSIPGQVVFTVTGLLSLKISSTSTTLTAPTPADYKAGFNSTAGPTLTVAANQPWTLHIRAAAALWTATNTPGNVAAARQTKPAADLRWSTASGGAYTPLSTIDVNVVKGLASDGTVTALFFRTVYNWALDTPGNYSLAMLLTLTAP